MIRLYNRDAQVVSELLTLLAPHFAEGRSNPERLYQNLAEWAPADVEATHAERLWRGHTTRGDIVSARLMEIVAAIAEQQEPR